MASFLGIVKIIRLSGVVRTIGLFILRASLFNQIWEPFDGNNLGVHFIDENFFKRLSVNGPVAKTICLALIVFISWEIRVSLRVTSTKSFPGLIPVAYT